jgi:hypothetical protein
MTFLKGVFYMKSFGKYPVVPNEAAKTLLHSDKDAYLKKISSCVAESLTRVYDAPEPGCLVTFTEPKPAHYNLRLDILGAAAPDDAPGGEGGATADSQDHHYDASNEAEDEDDRDADRQSYGVNAAAAEAF